MPKLQFGVETIPYPQIYNIGSRRATTVTSSYGKGMTTADVAKILEAKYGVMAMFAKIHHDELVEILDVPGMVKNVMEGGTLELALTTRGQSTIKSMFRQFLMAREMDYLVEGVPTKASLQGVSHRALRPRGKGRDSRPSFIDTRLYASAFKSWIEN